MNGVEIHSYTMPLLFLASSKNSRIHAVVLKCTRTWNRPKCWSLKQPSLREINDVRRQELSHCNGPRYGLIPRDENVTKYDV